MYPGESPVSSPVVFASSACALLGAFVLVSCSPVEAAPVRNNATTTTTVTSTTADTTTTTTSPIAGNPEVLPGEAWIAFQGYTAGPSGVFLVRTDGTGAHFPMADVPGFKQQHPDWSPDGARIVFTVTDISTEDVWVADADGENPVRLVDCVSPCVWADEPAWSPGGQQIAFHRMVEEADAGLSTLEILDVDAGSVEVVLTAGPTEAFYAPRWSPDGRYLVAEIAERGGESIDLEPISVALVIIDLAGTPPTVRYLTPAGEWSVNPDWSPSSDLIVFAAPVIAGQEGQDLYTIRSDGSELARLTTLADQGGNAAQPTFTPDGTGIIFLMQEEPDTDYMMATVRIDGTNLGPATSSGYRIGDHPRLRPTP